MELWTAADAADSAITVKEVVEKVIKYYGKGVWKDVSKRGSSGESSASVAKNQCEPHSEPHKHEAKLLNLEAEAKCRRSRKIDRGLL